MSKFTDFEATMIVEGQWELAGVEPNEDDFIDACQHLINTGLAWTLQGHFGRICKQMLDEGMCYEPVEEFDPETYGDDDLLDEDFDDAF